MRYINVIMEKKNYAPRRWDRPQVICCQFHSRAAATEFHRACLSSCADCAMSMKLLRYCCACAATIVVIGFRRRRWRCRRRLSFCRCCRVSCFVIDLRAIIAKRQNISKTKNENENTLIK